MQQAQLEMHTELHGALPATHVNVDDAQWVGRCESTRAEGGRLVALWGSDERARGNGFTMHCVLVGRGGFVWMSRALDAHAPRYPALDPLFPCAARMQRAAFDLLGVSADGAQDQRKWLRHTAWSAEQFPLRKDFAAAPPQGTRDEYPFVRVHGDGVHEIAVGPVHAGVIEPGHFRFSVVGERTLRLEERLGYKHKGIEKRFESLSPNDAAKLAGRVSGDNTVTYAWAYAMAVEAAAGITVPQRAAWLRALLLELERVANHLGDLGYLGNDAAFSFGFAQFWILKENVLRLNEQLFGHRYLMDCIVPGGVSGDLNAQHATQLLNELDAIAARVGVLRKIYDEHPGMQDRFLTTGIVAPELAASLGLIGLAGRASAQAWDLRAQLPYAPYDQLDVRMATHRNGDVAARVIVRFDEIAESLRLMREIVARLPDGPVRTELPPAPARARGLGCVEGWRGEVLIALETNDAGALHRVHAHDPSWHNWPLLEHAVIGNIVPDFPLINKSFNLSYSGHDL